MIGTPVSLVVGIILILFALFLYFLEKVKPGYKRDSDVVYAVMSLGLGVVTLIDYKMDFGQAIQCAVFTGIFISLALEVINGRTPDNSPKSNGMSPRDDDRPARSYRAGFEENFGAMDDRGGSRRQMRDGRGGRDDFESRDARSSSGRTERDRFLEDRPQRRPARDESSDRGSRRGRDSFGDDPAPRSIPERTSASDPRADRPARDEFEDVPRPRRRPESDEPRRSRPERTQPDAGASDYVEFRPVEPIPPKESWGPKD